MLLTLILPTPKVISLWCHQYRARPTCTSVQCDQALYCWPTSSWYQVLILISLKMIMDSAKNWRWIIPFKKFGMVSVKTDFIEGLNKQQYGCNNVGQNKTLCLILIQLSVFRLVIVTLKVRGSKLQYKQYSHYSNILMTDSLR